MATISAEIAAALAKAQARIYEDEDGEEDEETGSELGQTDSIIPNTSGIRGEDGPGTSGGGAGSGADRGTSAGSLGALLGGDEEEEEFEIETILESKSDAFGKVCVFDATMGRFVASHSQRRVLGQLRISREVERVCRGA